MTNTVLLWVAIAALCLVSGSVIIAVLLRPRARRPAAVTMLTAHGRDLLDGKATPCLGVSTSSYSDLFEQFERAVIEAEFGFERRQTAQELLGRIRAADQAELMAPDQWFDVDTITRTELLSLRERGREK